MENKAGRSRFFQKTFWVADTIFEAVLGMFFLKISNADKSFEEKTLMWESYTTNEALLTTKRIQIVNLKKFVIVALDVSSETFVTYVIIWEQKEIPVYFKKQAQVRALIFDEAPIEVSAEYSDYNNVFSTKNMAKIPENTRINEYAIKLKEGKQPPFKPIYSLGHVELKTLKTYIKTKLANSFIQLSKSPAGALILFDRKPDRSFL